MGEQADGKGASEETNCKTLFRKTQRRFDDKNTAARLRFHRKLLRMRQAGCKVARSRRNKKADASGDRTAGFYGGQYSDRESHKRGQSDMGGRYPMHALRTIQYGRAYADA